MMKWIFAVLAVLVFVKGFAQLSAKERLQDSVIGWDPTNYYDRNFKTPTTATGKQKMAYVNKFAEWVQKTYTPVAGLGEYQRYVNENNYSVLFHIWDVEFNYLDAQKRFRPVGETGYPRFYIAANMLGGYWNIDFMCKPDEWYFTMQPNGRVAETPLDAEKKMKGRDPRIDPNVYPYITWINDWDAVYLAPGNKLPIIQVSKGEFLQKALSRMDYLQDSLIKEDLSKEYRKDEATKNGIISRRKTEIDQYRDNIQQLLTKYKSQLSEPAMVTNWQFTYHDIITGSWDVFKRGPNTMYYPVYKLDAAAIQKMKDAKPLWIAILLPHAAKEDGNKRYEMYASLTHHLNYEYIYNYFFDSAKVKGVAYTPANNDQLKARMDAYKNRNNHNLTAITATVSNEPGIHFKEDFSANTEGSEPINWYYYKAGAKAYSVESIAGEKGRWLKLGYGRAIKPSLMKTPLPKSFTLEYDLATDKNYSGRTGAAATVTLTNHTIITNNDVRGISAGSKGALIEIRAESGNEDDYNNNNYRGILRVDIHNTPDPNEQNFSKGIRAEYALREFTNKKSKVHISVQLKDGLLSIFVNGKQVIKPTDFKMTYGADCKLCGIPVDLQLTGLLVNNNSNDNSIGAYISNISIRKE
ncbi:MAG: hypothetical protein QM726_25350 [Chitinophagaceae bacterium]